VNENEKRKEKILGFITEFGIALTAQPEVKEAVLSRDIPLWQRLIIPDMVLCFEEVLRKNLETADVQPVRAQEESTGTLDLPGLPED
jgi:hypothetical protein